MRKIVAIAGVALLATAHANSAQPAKTTMADFVRAVLPSAVRNFASLRGAKIESNLSNAIYAAYKLRLKPELCSDCWVTDWYGRGKSAEEWSVGNIYTEDRSGGGDLVQPAYAFASPETPEMSPVPGAGVRPPGLRSTPPPEWPVQKTERYVRSQLGPLLVKFSLRHISSSGLTGGDVPTLRWYGPNNTWVEAKMYPQMVAGILKVGIRVVHVLRTSTHVLRPATPGEIAGAQTSLIRIVSLALAAAPENFSALRGALKNDDASGHDYRVTGSIGAGLRSCEILDIAARMGRSWDSSQPAWAMNCSTIPVLGTKANLEDGVRSAVARALPAGFTAAANAAAFGDDYRWNGAKNVSVALGSVEDDGIVSFQVRFLHFLPKP